MRAAVVGHVEWVEFVRVDALPRAGEIVHGTDFWEEAAGGGPGAASQLMKLAGNASLFTALGDDETGMAALKRLSDMGLDVHAATRSDVTRRAVTFVDAAGERTITVIGRRLSALGADPLPWEMLGETDACYFPAGDVAALRAARRSGVLVATSRVLSVLAEGGIRLDALVGSDVDRSERYGRGDIDPVPDLVVLTNGAEGGRFSLRGGDWQGFETVPLRHPIVDRYGAGDSFAGALAFGLAAGLGPEDAIHLAARCGAAVLSGRGPYDAQLSFPDVADLVRTRLEEGSQRANDGRLGE